MQVLDVKYGVVAIMESKMGNKSKDIGMKVKTFIPCMLVHTDEEQGGMPESITCVGVFDVIACFDFPSLPRNFHTFLLIETPKGSYDIGMNIIDEKENILIPEKIGKFDIPEDHTVVNFNHVFINVIFPKEGMYFFQLIVDDKVIYKYDFRAVKIFLEIPSGLRTSSTTAIKVGTTIDISLIFPEAVFLNLFAAPLFVLIFGIFILSFLYLLIFIL